MDKKEIEIPFGAFDSELMHQEINIPEGFEAEIKGDKIILKKIESEDERIRKVLVDLVKCNERSGYKLLNNIPTSSMLAWLEKQGKQKHAWGEEDEKTLNEMFSVAARASLRKSTLFGKSYDYIKWQSWLKSIKDRYTWKPSKEQIIALRWVLNNVPYNKHKEEISGLLDQIKDL